MRAFLRAAGDLARQPWLVILGEIAGVASLMALVWMMILFGWALS